MARRSGKLASRDCTSKSCAPTIESKILISRFGGANEKMQGFKSAKSAQRFVSVHAAVYNTFHVQRHLISRRIHRQFRTAAVWVWLGPSHRTQAASVG
jgi:transposase-like protein